jgi:hypothetical protein
MQIDNEAEYVSVEPFGCSKTTSSALWAAPSIVLRYWRHLRSLSPRVIDLKQGLRCPSLTAIPAHRIDLVAIRFSVEMDSES